MMTIPELFVSARHPIESDADVVVLAVCTIDGAPTLRADPAYGDIAGQLEILGVTGAPDEVLRIPGLPGTSSGIALVGIGSEATPNSLRQAAGTAVRQLTGVKSVAFAFQLSTHAQVEAVLEGAALGAYSFTAYRHSSLASVKLPAHRVTVHTTLDAAGLVERASTVADAVRLVKDLVNTPPSDMFPQALAERAASEAVGLPLQVEVWDESRLAAEGFGGLAGVGQGSTRPPRLVKVSYSPPGAARHLALVGKGITFDTGGLSLKPAASMVGMKSDMAGAATVLAVTLAAARLSLPVRVTAWLCIAENMPSGSAIRPEDVLHIRGGRTVEVLNTDAEGRIVLADGLVAAGEEHPDAIVDVATLTGAATVALGTRYFAVMGDENLVEQVLAASDAVDELAWPMPLPGELRALLKSEVADIANAKIGNKAAGMLLAAVFLKEFIGTNGDGDAEHAIPWAHLDIAGSALNERGGWGYTRPGATGVSVRALVRLAEEFSRP
ncbi:MAG: aminopeptidase [Cryobacterium sp.]|jgi:leucyl aminopeptidase|nr:aminopeptidase [Cryobacterium sp.]